MNLRLKYPPGDKGAATMGTVDPVGSPFGRALGQAVCGVFAGVVFGLLIEILFFWSGPPESGVHFPLVGPLLGASSLAVVAVAVGAWPLPGWLARLMAGVLGGVVAGVLVGALLSPPLTLALSSAPDPALAGKQYGAAQRAGVIFGAPLGALAGLLVVGCARRLRRGGQGQAGQTP